MKKTIPVCIKRLIIINGITKFGGLGWFKKNGYSRLKRTKGKPKTYFTNVPNDFPITPTVWSVIRKNIIKINSTNSMLNSNKNVFKNDKIKDFIVFQIFL